jgi:hypothetical protein
MALEEALRCVDVDVGFRCQHADVLQDYAPFTHSRQHWTYTDRGRSPGLCSRPPDGHSYGELHVWTHRNEWVSRLSEVRARWVDQPASDGGWVQQAIRGNVTFQRSCTHLNPIIAQGANPRSAVGVYIRLQEQVKMACKGDGTGVGNAQTKYGVKCSYTQVYIDQILAMYKEAIKNGVSKKDIEQELSEYVADHEADMYNPLLRLAGGRHIRRSGPG